METMIELSAAEMQSKTDRVRHAELLISQLPAAHDGRNTWILNYGVGAEAKKMRANRRIRWVEETRCAETVRR